MSLCEVGAMTNTNQNSGGLFSREATLRVWLYDLANENINPLLNHRYHLEGWCVSPRPYGDQVLPMTTPEGNPNKFHCPHCDLRFMRVVVADEEEARRLKAMNAKTFDGTNGLRGVGSYPVSHALWGCNCVSGAEHAGRPPHKFLAVGFDQGEVVVPLVYGDITITVDEKTLPQTSITEAGNFENAPSRQFLPDDWTNPFADGEALA